MAGAGGGLDDIVFDGEAGEAGDIVQIEFAHEIGAVIFGGFDGDIEDVGDFLGAVGFGDELEDFAFACGEAAKGVAALGVGFGHGLAEEFGDLRGEVGTAGGDDVEASLQFAEGGGFADEAMGSGLDHFAEEGGILVAGKDEDVGIGHLFFDAAEDLGAIEAGQHDIEDDELGFGFEALLDGGAAIAGGGDDFPVILGGNELADHIANGGMVFNNGYFFHGK